MADAFTAGPWEVSHADSNGQSVVKAEHIEIATCWHHCVGSIEKEMHHNARLIAAAPDLLAASIAVLEMCEQHGDFRNGVTDPTGSIDEGEVIASRYFGTLRTAIAKATGNK